jgi:P4 family phage/plasmid primase-like protien
MLFLFPAAGQFIGKKITPAGPAPRANVFWWNWTTCCSPVNLDCAMDSLILATNGIYVHGSLHQTACPDLITRRMKNSPLNKADKPAEVGLIEDYPLALFCLDFDGAPLDTPLPPFLQDISHIRQWTSRDDPTNPVRFFRLWFLFADHNRETIRRDLLHAYNWSTIPGLDVSPWAAPCHPVFLADPIFEGGALDPHEGRSRWELVEGLLGERVNPGAIPVWVPPVRTKTAAKGTTYEIQAACEDVLNQRAKAGRHGHAHACVCDLVSVGADDDTILATITELFQVQGREPGSQEIERMILSARAKDEAGELHGPVLTSSLLPTLKAPAKSKEHTEDEFLDPPEGSKAEIVRPKGEDKLLPKDPDAGDPSAVILGKNDTFDALTFLHLYYPEGGLIRMYKGFYEWRAGKYATLSDEEMESRITFKCGHLTQKQIKGILSALKGYTQVYGLPAQMPVQFELGEGVGHRKEYLRSLNDLIVFRNGMLPISEWLANPKTVQLLPLTAKVFCRSVLPFDYDPAATAPRFNKFLSEVLPEADQQRLARKWLGAALLAENRYQVIFIACGPAGSGKSTFAKVMRSLVGVESLASATMQSVSSEFGTFPLLTARIILMPEANSTEGHGSVITSKIKAWSGEDPIPFCRKFADGFTAQMPGRILLVANEVPTFPDPSGAILRRISALHFNVSFIDKEDRDIGGNMLEEMGGVMNEALSGLRILIQEDMGFSKKTDKETTILEDYRDDVMPVVAFLRQCCVANEEHSLAAKDLYNVYRRWSEDQGMKFQCQQSTFTRRLDPALLQLKLAAKKHRVTTGTAWQGLAWSPVGQSLAPAFPST